MKRCKNCNGIILLENESEWWLSEQLATINENSLKQDLCIKCFHKEIKHEKQKIG